MSKLTIIGGGIGGLTLANALQHFKIEFEIYEAASELTEVGAGIGISESTITILEKLGLGEKIKKSGNYVQDAIVVDKMGRTIRKLPIKNGGFCIHRMHLIEILKENIDPSRVFLNHNLTSINNNKQQRTSLTFENGKTIETEYVIASDGINSKIRKSTFPEIKKRFSGQTIWRGISTINLKGFFENTYLEFWGDNLRFATIPIGHNAFYWYAVKEVEEGLKDNPATIKSDLKKLFKGFNKELLNIIDQTSHIIRNDMYDLEPHNKPWHKDNLVFMGDAIHATTPNLAQGGCQAIEDAFTLAKIIGIRGLNHTNFDYYKSLRKDKVFSIVNQSWRYGQISHQNNKLTEFLTKMLFKILPTAYFVKQYQQLIDIEYLKRI